ncbi:MAG: phosphodiester glycosidase family protein [Candidatus Baltobacteraceae bacterium]
MTIRRVVIAAAALFMLAVLAGSLRNPLRRVLYELSFNATTGARLHIVSLSQRGADVTFRGVTITAAGGDAVFSAARIRVYQAHGQRTVAIDAPYATLRLGHDTLRRLRRLRAGLALLAPGAASVSITDGTLNASRAGSDAAPLALRAFNGSVVLAAHTALLEGNAQMRSGAQRYPVAVSGGRVRAAELPLAPLWALLPASDLSVSAGFAQNVDVALLGRMSGTLAVRGVEGTYAGHVLHALHGTILLAPDGLATRAVAGNLDGLPLQLSGEVHDVHDWNLALRTGTPNLRGVARVFGMIASTPQLRWLRLETTAPGIAFAQYGMVLSGAPRVVQLLTIDPREKTVHFNTALSGDHLVSSGERTSQMGVRTGAVAGLNGDYFDIARTYQPQGLFMRSGRLVRGPANRQALIVDRNNNVHFDEFRLEGSAQIGTRTLPVTQYNDWPLGYVTIVTPDFGGDLPPVSGLRFLTLQYVRGDRYRVTGVTLGRVPSPLRFGIALGADVKNLRLPAVGDEVRLSYHIDPPVTNAVAAIGGGPLLLRDGKWYEDPHAPAPDERDVRWPVDALGVLDDKTLIMVAVDGRHPERSAGMTRPEFGHLLQDLGVTDAMALDSGGSVTLVARSPGDTGVSLHNVPSDDSAERYVSNGIFVYSSAPQDSLLQNTPAASVSTRN